MPLSSPKVAYRIVGDKERAILRLARPGYITRKDIAEATDAAPELKSNLRLLFYSQFVIGAIGLAVLFAASWVMFQFIRSTEHGFIVDIFALIALVFVGPLVVIAIIRSIDLTDRWVKRNLIGVGE